MTAQQQRAEFLTALPPVKEDTRGGEKPYMEGPPDTSMFNEDQRAAFQALTNWLDGPDTYFALKGNAGTGKTFVVTRLVQHFMAAKRMAKVAMAAPTNKAVRVLRDMAPYYHGSLEYATIHSLLALVEKITPRGEITFVRDSKRDPSIGEYRLVIVDEASMVSQELFGLLDPEVGDKMKVLFVGDPSQIPPVGEEEGAPFDPLTQEVYEISEVCLTEVVRQAKGNPMIEATMDIRNGAFDPAAWRFRPDAAGTGGVAVLAGNTATSELDKLLRTLFCSPNFAADPDFAKVVAWTNASVDALNDLIRGYLYGKGRKKLEVGERLIANTPILQDGAIIVTTNGEMRVLSYEEATDKVRWNNEEFSVRYYSTEVEVMVNGAATTRVVWIIHEEEEEFVAELLKTMAANAKTRPPGAAQGLAWKEFFNFKRRYADVKYNYAITAHKAQGSTYDNAVVLKYDIDKNKRRVERMRVLYTACTRPRFKLFVVD